MLSQTQINQFIQNGYLVLKQVAEPNFVEAIRHETYQQLTQRIEPFELEATVQYPGAPSSEEDNGGKTIRRLRQAYDRHELYKQWAANPYIVECIKQILQCDDLYLNRNHHNSVMTKNPKYSSQTNWHRDTRYWNFDNKYLVNSWLAMGPERGENGGLLVLPGSHRWDDGSFVIDEQQFLIEDHPANQSRLSLSQNVELEAGDCLLFSAHCFHAAAQNKTDSVKLSLVYTYHSRNTRALVGTNSEVLEPILME